MRSEIHPAPSRAIPTVVAGAIPRGAVSPRLLVAAAGGLLLLAAALLASPWQAQAQRPVPPGALEILGRRHAVVRPTAGGAAADSVLHVSNIGWSETRLAVLAVDSSQPDACPAPRANMTVLGCGNAVSPMALLDMDMDRDGGAGHLMVYSLDTEGQAAACRELDAVARGDLSLGQWERSAWQPGEPVAVRLAASDGPQGTTVSGTPLFVDLVPQLPNRFRGLSYALAAVENGASAYAVNPSAECVTVDGTWAPLHQANCPPATEVSAALAPHSGRLLPTGDEEGATHFAAGIPLATLAEHRDETGWYTAPGSIAAGDLRQFSLPLGAGLFDGLTGQLWVTNHHITATTQIDVFMYDGAGQLHDFYTDPAPLCAGGTRVYDVTTLAGEIPPSRRGPPMVSLRVTSTNLELSQAPPVSGAVVLDAQGDKAALAGAVNFNPLQFLAGRDVPLDGRPVTVVPNVRKAAGTPATTTALLVQDLRGVNQSRMYLTFYDRSGGLVFEDAFLATRGDGAVFLDLSEPLRQIGGGDRGTPLPDGFEGTVIIRPESPRSTLSVAAFDHLASGSDRQPPFGDIPFAMSEGVALIWPNDPSVPTPTAFPTTPPPSPTPEQASFVLFLPAVHYGLPSPPQAGRP